MKRTSLLLATIALAAAGCPPNTQLLPGPATRPSAAYIADDAQALADFTPAINRDESAHPEDAAIVTAWRQRTTNPPATATAYLQSENVTFVVMGPVVQRDGGKGTAIRYDGWWQRLSAADAAIDVPVPSEPAMPALTQP